MAVWAFSDFELDSAAFELREGGRPVRLEKKSLDLLILLAENQGQLVTRDRIVQALWGDEVYVETDLGINTAIRKIRQALHDDPAAPRFLQTVVGKGYRFIAPVGAPRAAAATSVPTAQRTWILALAGLVLAAAGYAVIRTRSAAAERVDRSVPPVEQIRLTTGGRASRAAISPDGAAVVYTENGDLKIRQLADGRTRVLRPATPDVGYVSLAVSPEGKSVYYSARQGASTVRLYRLPLVGGEPEKILEGIYGGITFSPDGKAFAFIRRYPELNEYSLLIADADGSNVRRLAGSSRPDNFDGTPSWSPDGATIVCPRLQTEGGYHVAIATISVKDGSVAKIPTRRWSWMHSLVWMPDSRAFWIVAQDQGTASPQLWRLDRSSGEVRQLSADSYIYESLSGARDGTKLVAIKRRLESHVWVVEDGQVAQVTTGFDKYDGVGGLDWMPDGRLLYHSRASGRDAIWLMNADGSDAQLVTTDGGGGFDVSPDGRNLFFQSADSGRQGLTALDLHTRDKKRLTDSGTDMTPDVDPRNQWIVYSHFSEKHALYRVPLTGGQPKSLFDRYRTVSSPVVSPDGSRIAFAFGRTQTDSIQSGIGVISAEDGRLLATYPVRLTFGTLYERPTIQWSPDGRFLHYLERDGGLSNLWRVDTLDGSSSPVTRFTAGRIFNYAFSDDGRRLALARGAVESDVLVMRSVH